MLLIYFLHFCVLFCYVLPDGRNNNNNNNNNNTVMCGAIFNMLKNFISSVVDRNWL